MGLKITRTRENSQALGGNQPESSTLISARHEYDALVGVSYPPAIMVKLRDFTDGNPNVSDEAVKPLFDHLWEILETDHRSDVVLDFLFVTDIGPRFRRELVYLHRHIHHQGRSVRLRNVSSLCHLEDLSELV